MLFREIKELKAAYHKLLSLLKWEHLDLNCCENSFDPIDNPLQRQR